MPAPLYVLPNGGGWAYGGFVLDRDIARLPAAHRCRRSPTRSRAARVGHAVGRAARSDACRRTRFVDIGACAPLPRETDEQMTARILGYAGERVVAVPDRRPSATRARRGSRALLRDGLDRGDDAEPEGRVVRRAARRRDHAGDASRGCAACGKRRRRCPGCRSPKPTTRRWRWSSPCARCRAGASILDDAAGAHRESRSQGALPVRHAGAVGRSRRARALVPVAEGRRQPPARAVGARRPRATCTIRCARRRRRSTCGRASTCCGRSRRPATSSFRSAGWMPRSAATPIAPSPPPCGGSWTDSSQGIQTGCARSSCNPPTSCSGLPASSENTKDIHRRHRRHRETEERGDHEEPCRADAVDRCRSAADTAGRTADVRARSEDCRSTRSTPGRSRNTPPQPFFTSPLVDYLPASKTVPTPKAVLGDVAGAPGKLPYSRGGLPLHADAREGHARA